MIDYFIIFSFLNNQIFLLFSIIIHYYWILCLNWNVMLFETMDIKGSRLIFGYKYVRHLAFVYSEFYSFVLSTFLYYYCLLPSLSTIYYSLWWILLLKKFWNLIHKVFFSMYIRGEVRSSFFFNTYFFHQCILLTFIFHNG